MSEGLVTSTEIVAKESDFLSARAERQRALQTKIINTLQTELDLDQADEGEKESFTTHELLGDEYTNAVLQLRAMNEVNELYQSAKPALGRELTLDDEQLFHVTLEYVLKRLITDRVKKIAVRTPEFSYKSYIICLNAGMVSGLPGDRDLFAYHDIVHVVLALKQGLENENSPVPMFMQAETGVNTDQQAMLEEAFALLFSVGIHPDAKRYDDLLLHPESLYKEACNHFYPERSPIDVKIDQEERALFSDPALALEAQLQIQTFYEVNRGALSLHEFFTNAVMLSQSAAFGEGLRSEEFRRLTDVEKLASIERRLLFAQRNIDVLLSGEVPDDASAKYEKTVTITRDTYATAERSVREHPEQPVFVEILLDTLRPLQAKAAAQSDATFSRLEI